MVHRRDGESWAECFTRYSDALKRRSRWTMEAHAWKTAFLADRLLPAPPRIPSRALFVIATPRTGSNLLVDYLNCFPRTRVLDEVLHPEAFTPSPPPAEGESVGPHLHSVLRILARRYQTTGMKIMLEQLAAYHWSVRDLVRLFPNARYLLVYRRSLLRQYVSLCFARQTRAWVSTRALNQGRVHVDRDAFLAWARELRRGYREAVGSLSACPHGLVSYEALSRNPQQTLRRQVCPTLGESRLPELKTALVKQTPGPLESRISNYEEVSDLVDEELELSP